MDPSYQGEFRWNLNGYGRKEYPHPHPRDIRDVIQGEIEKERIREEIITSEIVRRRVLEAEVRRELMMEREMALRQGIGWFPVGSSPVMGLESPMRPSLLVTKAEGWSAEERLAMALEEKLKRSENGGLETLPFQRGTVDPRISEVKPASEDHKGKERIFLLTKTDENASGSKTKDVTAPEVVNIELLADDIIANEISKEEWSCALCQVMATSEKDLNEHVLGKKHKSNVAALPAQGTRKNYSIGLFPKEATKPIHVKEKGVKLKAQSSFSQKAGKATSKKDDLPLSENSKSKLLKKTQAEVIRKVQKNEEDERKKVEKNEKVMNAHKLGNIELPVDVIKNKKWSCALCQVIASSENDLNEHVLEKKHKSKVAALEALRTEKNHSTKKVAKSIHVGEEGVKLKAQSLFSEKVEDATSKKDDLPLSGNPKSEHSKKTKSEVIQKVQKNEDDPRKKVEKKENDPRKNSEVTNAHKLGNIEPPADVAANKKSEWNCALCQVYSTSEKGLNEHVLGKKHKSKVAALEALRTEKNHSTKKAAESIHVGEEGVKLKAQSLFSEKVEEATSKKDDLPLSGNPKSEHLKKTQSEVIQKVQKNEDDSRKKVEKKENDPRKNSEVMNAHKLGNIEPPADVAANKKSEWNCALCQVYATSEKGLNEHVLGKKHKSKEAASRSSED